MSPQSKTSWQWQACSPQGDHKLTSCWWETFRRKIIIISTATLKKSFQSSFTAQPRRSALWRSCSAGRSTSDAGNYLYLFSCICVYSFVFVDDCCWKQSVFVFLYLCICHWLLLIMYSVSEMMPEILYLSKESSIGVRKLCQMPPNAWIGSMSNAGQTEILMQMHFREFKLVSVMLLRLNGPEK